MLPMSAAASNVTTGTKAPEATTDPLEVVLVFPSVSEYRAMGKDIEAVRLSLGLPAWSTPTEVIARALRDQASAR
jgi:hypothetical protein